MNGGYDCVHAAHAAHGRREEALEEVVVEGGRWVRRCCPFEQVDRDALQMMRPHHCLGRRVDSLVHHRRRQNSSFYQLVARQECPRELMVHCYCAHSRHGDCVRMQDLKEDVVLVKVL